MTRTSAHAASLSGRGWWLAGLVLLAGQAMAQCEMTVAWEPWPPYQFEDGSGGVSGVDGDLIAAIMGEMGCEIAWVARTWKRQLEGVEKGDIDAVMSASYTEDRAVWGQFSKPYRQSANHLVVVNDLDGRYPTLAAFLADGKRLGIMKDYHYGDEVMAMLADSAYAGQIRPTVAAEANMKMLSTGRVDGILMDVFVAASLKRQLDVGDRVAADSLEVSTDDLHLLFSRASVSEEQVAEFDRVLERLIADGTIQSILDSYSQ